MNASQRVPAARSLFADIGSPLAYRCCEQLHLDMNCLKMHPGFINAAVTIDGAKIE
jgi:hypothetical protein